MGGLKDRGYVKVEKKNLVATDTGLNGATKSASASKKKSKKVA